MSWRILQGVLALCLITVGVGCQIQPAAKEERNVGSRQFRDYGLTRRFEGRSDKARHASTAAPPRKTTARAPRTKPHGKSGNCATVYYPTGRRTSSVLELVKCGPESIRVDSSFEYELCVRNISDRALNRVEVRDQIADGYELQSASPAPDVSGDRLVWRLGTLDPGAQRTITVKGHARREGTLRNCAVVTYQPPRVCLPTNVVNPRLALAIEAPESALACEEIPVTYRVTNTGSGTARDISLRHQLPEGLRTKRGEKSALTATLQSLQANETREYSTVLEASKAQAFIHRATVEADGGRKATARATTDVRRPRLAVTKHGPESRWFGHMVTYQIAVKNNGDGEARKLVVEDDLPDNAEVVGVSDGGTIRDDRVTWRLGTLGAGETTKVWVELRPRGKGEITNHVEARAFCAEPVASRASTEVKGVSAILLEVVDEDDPVEVGSTTTYRVEATNQGSATERNIRIECRLEEEMGFVEASGATAARVEGKVITFEDLPALEPGETATWSIRVKARGEASVRFDARMTSDFITDRPVRETEATTFYE